ncbi:MAG: ABC transporter ATP-binding protein [Firmicutes bacterium]|nr:ABC transporter ATP-binding protein [Bacillota bacterium]
MARMGNANMKMAQGIRKKTISPKTIKRLLGYVFRKHKLVIFIVGICILLSSFADVYSQLFLKELIDDYITPLINSVDKNFIPLINAIVRLAGVFVVGTISMYLYNRLMVNVSQGVLKDIRDEMFEKMEKLPIRYFDTNSHGDIMSHYTNDTDVLRQMISQSIPNVVAALITLTAVFISMIYLNWLLTLIVVLCIFLMLFISSKVAKISGKYFIAQQESIGKVNGYIEEMIDGQKVIKVFTHEDKAKESFDKINNELCKNSTKANVYANMMMPMMANLGNITYVIVAICGGVLAIFTPMGSTLTLGTIAAFLTMTKNFTHPISRISQQINFIIMALSGATRIFELMDEKPEENNGTTVLVNVKKNQKGLVESKEQTGYWAWKKDDGTLIELKGDVRFNNVSFGYNKDKEILHNISLYAKPGQKIAFVGSTGAGKTTIMNLINAFYDVNEGSITYDGIDIKEINKSYLRKSFGMVLQDTNLFTGTILDNIRYGNTKASDKECIEAAKLANADSFIRNLPDGYKTMLTGNGANLSQGQRQLLSIARCALLNPPVMILDEATSSIDTRTEKIVQDGMDKLMQGRTVFVIAHRLSTIQNAKAIMVLENGKIIERGSHEELLELKGTYYGLYTGSIELD